MPSSFCLLFYFLFLATILRLFLNSNLYYHGRKDRRMKFVSEPIGNWFGVRLDISDLNLPKEVKEQLIPYLTFNVKTYQVLSSKGVTPDRFNVVCGAGNWYLEHASEQDKVRIAEYYAMACKMIRTEMPTVVGHAGKLSEFIRKLGEMYVVVAEACNLRSEFRAYADANIQLQDISDYGSRPQDSKELTFTVPQMKELMDLAFLIKMVAPILGELMLNIPDRTDSDGRKRSAATKESEVVEFVIPLIEKSFREIDDKLQFFIEHIVETQCRGEENPAATFAGLIVATRVKYIHAAILIRNFVCIVLERTDSNIVRFVDTMVHSHLISQNNVANRNQVRSRKPAAAFGAAGEDADNTAQMETDSVVSNRPLDIAIIIAHAVDRVVDDLLITHQITHDEMDQCMDYLIRHPVMPTPLSKFLAYAVFGDKLGGGRGIDLLDRREYTRLICLLQMIVFHLGLKELGHMLTANRTDTVRLMKTPEETKFELNYGTGFAYRACKDRFASMSRASDGKEWDRQMHDICEDIVNHKYTYNTPLFIMDQLGDDAPVNGEVIPVEIEIISEACSVITMFCGHSV